MLTEGRILRPNSMNCNDRAMTSLWVKHSAAKPQRHPSTNKYSLSYCILGFLQKSFLKMSISRAFTTAKEDKKPCECNLLVSFYS